MDMHGDGHVGHGCFSLGTSGWNWELLLNITEYKDHYRLFVKKSA